MSPAMIGSPLLYLASLSLNVYVSPSDETVGMSVARAGTTFRSLSRYSKPRPRAWSTLMSVLVDAFDGSSVSGSSDPRDTCRTPLASIGPDAVAPDGAPDAPPEPDAAGEPAGAEPAGAEPAGCDAAGADEVEAPPHAAEMTAMLAMMPSRRFCMGSPSNGLLPDDSRYRGPSPSSTPMYLLARSEVEPPALFGRWASSSASTAWVGALPVLSTAPHGLSTHDLTNVRSVASEGMCQSGQGVSAPVMPRQRRFG